MADEVKEVFPLTNGTGTMPSVGLGTFTVFGQMGTPEELDKAVKCAIEAGYRCFDCAWSYHNEAVVGEAIQSCISAGMVKREDLFISTKLWDAHHHPMDVKLALKASLKNLRTEYVDMYLMHWPMSLWSKPGDVETKEPHTDEDGFPKLAFHKIEDTWAAMEDCVRDGLAINIGISNFNVRQVERILASCKIKPSNHQIEISPYLSNKRLTDFSKERGMFVTAYAPLGTTGRTWMADSYPNPLEEPILQAIAAARGKTIAQVLLRFHLQNGVGVLPKSTTPSRVRENYQVFDFKLSEDEMKRIASLDRHLRIYKKAFYDPFRHPEYPFADER